MSSFGIQVVGGDLRTMLGESPVWSSEEQCLYLIDATRSCIHRLDVDTTVSERWDLPSAPGASRWVVTAL